MITGEFLVADDLCQAGRLAAPGETLVLRPTEEDQQLISNEVRWVQGKLDEVDRLLAKLSRLVPLRDGPDLERIFDAMVNWSAEAVKYGLMISYLNEVEYQLGKSKVDIFVRSKFNWSDYNVVSDFIDFLRVARAEQLKKFVDYAFTDEVGGIFMAASQMSISMRKKRT